MAQALVQQIVTQARLRVQQLVDDEGWRQIMALDREIDSRAWSSTAPDAQDQEARLEAMLDRAFVYAGDAQVSVDKATRENLKLRLQAILRIDATGSVEGIACSFQDLVQLDWEMATPVGPVDLSHKAWDTVHRLLALLNKFLD